MVNNRFPELEKAREEYLGVDPSRSPNKNLHATEVKKFSEVVYGLAHESEPHPARFSFLQKLKEEEERPKKGGIDSNQSLQSTAKPSVEDNKQSNSKKLP
jgi:hypothetical protein